MISDSERAQRARRFLGILLERDHWPAGNALQDVLAECDKPKDVPDELCAALDRALVAWAASEINDIMRELGVEEIVLKVDT